MRNPLKLGETYAAQKGFPREVELRVGAEVVLYMPATIISTEANGDGGYEGQYALSANHPMIARIKLVGRSSQPIETESVAVDDFAAANGGLDPTVPPQDDDSETASVKAGEPAPSYRWKIATSEAPQIYVNESSILRTMRPDFSPIRMFMWDRSRRRTRSIVRLTKLWSSASVRTNRAN